MENIRIGNSVHVSWRLYNNNGSQYVLSGKIRRLWIISAALEKEISSYGIQGRNELVFSIPADDLIRYGTYKIRLSIRESESGTEDATYELTQVFQVVSKSYPNASGAIGGVVELPFTTVLNNVVVERIEGLSAYEIAVNNGYEGTEQEWVAEYNNALNAATTAAADASAAITAFNVNEQARIEVENERVAAEAARVLAENGRASAEATRVSNESGRVAAEEARVSAEAGRVTAENGRVDAESSRVSAESSRVSAESSRVSAESARATRSASDHTRAENDHSLAVSDHSTASSDHTTAAGDHTTAVSDHTRAENDHTTAAADHTTAGGDHTTATGDHTQAVADHTQAASDHTASVSATADAIAAAAAATEAAESIEQSDWSENDSDDPAYIKSRTHWVDVETTTINDAKLAWSGSTPEDLDFWFHGTDVHIPRTSVGWGLTWEGGELFIDDMGSGYEIGVFDGEEWNYNFFDPSYDQQPYPLGVDVVIPSGTTIHKLDNKFLDMDTEPTTGSGKPVTSGGVASAISNFITRSVNDLANYYLKSETYTKAEVESLIGAIQHFHYEIYPNLESVTHLANNILYLIGPTGSGTDKYEEYVYDSTKTNPWVKIGDTSIDLSGYVTTEALNTALGNYVTSSALTTALATKQDALVSGTNIKTINGQPVLGSGDLVIPGASDAVKYTSQSLTDAQKGQSRTNIGAADAAEVSQLRSEVDGTTMNELSNPGIESSAWINNNGVLTYTPSGFGVHRVGKIPIKEGDVFVLQTAVGSSSADFAYVCDSNGNILMTVPKGSSGSIEWVAPQLADGIYINYLTTFSLHFAGINSQNGHDFSPQYGSLKTVTSGGIFQSVKEVSKIGKFVDFGMPNLKVAAIGSRWSASGGSISYVNDANRRRLAPIQVREGMIIRFPYVGIDRGYITDVNDYILVSAITLSDGAPVEIYCPPGSAKAYINIRNEESIYDVCVRNDIPETMRKYIPFTKGPAGYIDFSQLYFFPSNLSNGIPVFSSVVITSTILDVFPGATLTITTVNGRLGFTFFDSQHNYIVKKEWYSSGSISVPDNARYLQITLGGPSGSTERVTVEGVQPTVYQSATVKYAFYENPDDSLIEVPILSPSPQLPADGETGSDFDAETMTSTEIQAAIESQIDKLTVPNVGANPYAPKYGTIYETIGKDASGQYDIKAYVFTRRNRFAWRASAALYAWKSGSTTYYTDHRSPLVGDTVYSDDARTSSGYTVAAYNSAGPSITVNGNTYTRDDSAKVEATDIFTQTQLTTSSTTIQVYNKAGTSLGNATVSSPTQIVLSGKTYTRLPSGDFHTENKATIVIWGNEHGPQSDPTEPSIVIYRLIKDLCECRNNEFITFLHKYCKLVFIPAANPYGINKFVSDGAEGRNNFNHVNINRNYDTVGWGTQTDSDKGSYAGDQPETQFIMNTALDVEADIAIDIHCLGYASSVLNEGRTHYEGYVSAINGKVEDIMRGFCGHSYSSYGSESPTTRATGADWIYSLGIAGGLIEMNAGPYAVAFDGKQHNAGIMFTDYTLLLNVIRMWYYQFDPSLDLSRLSIR